MTFNKKLDRLVRRFVPSTALLSRNRLFQACGRITDGLAALFYPEFRQLPPNHLRVRVGVGNRIFFNQVHCLTGPTDFWLTLFANGMCSLDASIVEIGCGYGRKAALLRDYHQQEDRFRGHYLGIDIDPELLEFARSHFPFPNFRFEQTTHSSRTYLPDQVQASRAYRMPVEDESQDLVFSTSLFTHLLEAEALNYLAESYRVLKPGAWMQMNFFCLEYLAASGHLGGRWTFPHAIGQARVESLQAPEAAVAYAGEYLTALCRQLGFTQARVVTDPGGQAYQSYLRCRR